MEHRQNIVLFQKADELGTFFQILALQIEHMSVVGTLSRDMLQLDLAGFSQRQECLTVAVPAGQAVLVDLVSMQQLSPQVGSVQLAGQVAVTKIHPGVLVHLAAEELGAVGALFAQDLGALVIIGVVDDESAALAHRVVFRLVERVAAKIANGTQCLALVAAHHALGGILDHHQVVAAGNVHDGVHLAGDTGVVHGHNDLGLVGDGGFDLGLVDVHRVGAHIHKHQLGPGQHGSGGGAGEGEAGQDDLVTRVNIAQQHGHIQSGGAAGGQQHLLGVEAFLNPRIALLGKGTVTADLMGVDGLFDIFQLVPNAGGHIKRDHGKSPLSLQNSILIK